MTSGFTQTVIMKDISMASLLESLKDFGLVLREEKHLDRRYYSEIKIVLLFSFICFAYIQKHILDHLKAMLINQHADAFPLSSSF